MSASLACGLALAQSAPAMSYSGRMGEKALIVIAGEPRMVGVGQRVNGVRLVAVSGDSARIEVGGQAFNLPLGGTPQRVGGASAASDNGTIVLTAGLGGHFMSQGAINGRPVQFMVDTGATSVAMSQAEAQRLGIDLSQPPSGTAGTANGAVPVWRVVLTSVRVGEVAVSQVEAIVLPAAMPYVLLGNSFLSRFQMRRDNDVMRLELRR